MPCPRNKYVIIIGHTTEITIYNSLASHGLSTFKRCNEVLWRQDVWIPRDLNSLKYYLIQSRIPWRKPRFLCRYDFLYRMALTPTPRLFALHTKLCRRFVIVTILLIFFLLGFICTSLNCISNIYYVILVVFLWHYFVTISLAINMECHSLSFKICGLVLDTTTIVYYGNGTITYFREYHWSWDL